MILDNLPDIFNMVIRRIENFLRAFEKKFWVKNEAFWTICSQLLKKPILRVDSQKSKLFYISFYIIYLTCRAFLIFLLMQKTRIGAPSKYIEHSNTMRRKISTNLWKKVLSRKWNLFEAYAHSSKKKKMILRVDF